VFENYSFIDLSIIITYFAVILWISRKVYKGKNNLGVSKVDYFLAGKSQGWLFVGASLFASNIGSEIILGVSGAGASGNMPLANFEILASLILILFGWVFVPFYIKSGVYTMPEFLEKRYSLACRNYLSVVSIIAYVITKISLIIFAGALVFETMGIPFWTGAVFTVLITGFYTVLGGLKAVIYTDMIQAFILLMGSILVTFFGLYHIGGWNELILILDKASSIEGNPEVGDYFNLWRPINDNDYPWTGMLFGAPILGVWYWCTDQYIVQRALSAKNSIIARKGALFAGYLKILPVFIFFLPGVIAFALMQKGIINFSLDNADQALPAMISNFLPVGVKGIAIAGLLAALMSSLSSAFNSSSTLLTIDFYQKFRPQATDSQLVSFGRISTLFLVLISMGWIPFMKTLMTGGIFHYLQSIQAYISPPIASVFLFGLLYNWINSKGAIICLWTGFIIGIVRLVLEFLSKEGTIIVTKETLLFEFLQINFLHFALFLFVLCSIILIVFSKLTSKQITKNIEGLTIGTRERVSDSQKFNDIFFSIILVIVVLLLWLVFSPLGMG
tara:strand:- start:633 stop:2312 length:1680 start_codon:yes stop_codon:yes gene_type:complete